MGCSISGDMRNACNVLAGNPQGAITYGMSILEQQSEKS